MRRFYQESWQSIPFVSFADLSFFDLASTQFYAAFYEALFRRYSSWEELPANWRHSKDVAAGWLAEEIRSQRLNWETADSDAPPVVLSIGCGVGYMESKLLELVPNIKLHVTEPSSMGLKWLREKLPQDHIHIGLAPDCLPSDLSFDLIYLSTVDYGIETSALEHMLTGLRGQLSSGGRLISLSASLLEEDGLASRMVNDAKLVMRAILHFSGIRRQQFWGWRRTREEYHHSMQRSGFIHISDGWLPDGINTFWISGE